MSPAEIPDVPAVQAAEGDDRATTATGTGLALGISLGTALGAMFDTTGLGLVVGMLAGLLLGAIWDARSSEPEPLS